MFFRYFLFSYETTKILFLCMHAHILFEIIKNKVNQACANIKTLPHLTGRDVYVLLYAKE